MRLTFWYQRTRKMLSACQSLLSNTNKVNFFARTRNTNLEITSELVTSWLRCYVETLEAKVQTPVVVLLRKIEIWIGSEKFHLRHISIFQCVLPSSLHRQLWLQPKQYSAL